MNKTQRVVVVQQGTSGAKKIRALRRRGRGLVVTRVHQIPESLPPLLDDTTELLPERFDADLVLGFVRHPDLALDLAAICSRQGVPLVLSGHRVGGDCVMTPPT